MPHQLIYFADPMCSWCWGFAPVIRAVQEVYGDRLPVRLILGGLAVGTTKTLDNNGKATIRDHWRHVADLTGQPFDHGFFDRDDFVYDTEPACRAVVAARRLHPDTALPFLRRLHRAFYAENKDITDRATLAALAGGTGDAGDRFTAEWESDAARQETAADFQITRDTGIQGYPALLIGEPETGYAMVTMGYQPWQKVESVIEASLARIAAAVEQSAYKT